MKIWITVATWNRKDISEICIEQLNRFKRDNFLHISDDWSNQYKAEEIFSADKIEKPPRKLGIQKLRCWEMRKFLQTKYDFIYLTDSDAFHDPDYIDVLKRTWEKYRLPLSLYNAKAHSHLRNIVEIKTDVVIRKSMPGVSQFYSRPQIEKIVKVLDAKGDPNYAWDYRVLEYLKSHCATTRTSYLEHFGGPGSIHNKTLEKDRAQNPTNYLKEQSENIIQKLKTKQYYK